MRFFVVLILVMAFSLTSMLCAKELQNKASITVLAYPNVNQVDDNICKIGDTIYVVVEAHNPHDENVNFVNVFAGGHSNGTVQIELVDKYRAVPIPMWFEVTIDSSANWSPPVISLEPHERRVVGTYSVTLPPLEDLFGMEYWRDLLLRKNSPSLTHKLRVITAIGNEPPRQMKKWELLDVKTCYERYFELHPRTAKEMLILKKWYEDTPKDLLPYVSSADVVRPRKIGDKSYSEMQRNITLQHYHFLRIGNRYPGYPNLPKDWRGWKELEESFCEGTLRDEIRWTRICIQYCETKDDKVLEELKSWLEKMNPIQRAVMVNYIQKNEQLPESIKLHNTIQPFKNKPITNDIDKK